MSKNGPKTAENEVKSRRSHFFQYMKALKHLNLAKWIITLISVDMGFWLEKMNLIPNILCIVYCVNQKILEILY